MRKNDCCRLPGEPPCPCAITEERLMYFAKKHAPRIVSVFTPSTFSNRRSQLDQAEEWLEKIIREEFHVVS
jgi:hypothetical protein